MPKYPYFYAIEPKTFSPDRFYKVFVTDIGFYGAYLAGQIHSRAVARLVVSSAHVLGLFLWPYLEYVLKKREEREARYDSMDVEGPEFLAMDRRNFHIPVMEIRQAVLHTKPRYWGGRIPNSGRLELTFWNKPPRHFILNGDQDADSIRDMIARRVPQLEVRE